MPAETQFDRLYEQAHQKRTSNHLRAALDLYKQVFSVWTAEDGHTNLIAVLTEQGIIEKELRMFQTSNQTLTKALQLLINAYNNHKITTMEMNHRKYEILSDLALTACEESDEINDDNYQRYEELMTLTINNLRLCHEIVMGQLMLVEEGKIDKDCDSKWWKGQYLQLKVNVCSILMTIGQKLENRKIYKGIIEEVKRAEVYYENHGEKYEEHITRCYYYKAAVYGMLLEEELSEEYFMKNYCYEEKHNLVGDLMKTKEALRKLYIRQRRYKEARKIVPECAEEVVQIVANRERKYKMGQMLYERKNMLLEEWEEFMEYDEQTDVEQLLEFIIEHKRYMKEDIAVYQLFINYQAYYEYKLEKWEQAYRTICEEIGQLSRYERVERLLIKVRIREEVDSEGAVEEEYRGLLRMAEEEGNKIQIANCRKEFKRFMMGVRMGRAGWEVTSLKEKKYLKELQERKKERMEERMEESEQDEPRGRRLTKIGVKTSINKLMNKGKLSIKEFIELCKEWSVPVCETIIDCLTVEDAIETILARQIGLTENHLRSLLIDMAVPCKNIDLRAHHITSSLLEEISYQSYIPNVKVLKLNGIVLEEYNKVYNMLENNKKIEHLSLIHFDVENEGNLHKDVSNMIKDIKFLTLLRWSKDNLKNIRILKLKNCQLTDEDFQDIDVENYHLLEEFSLSHNLLVGHTLSLLKSSHFSRLTQLNLSDNPLQCLPLSLSLKSLKLRNIDYNSQSLCLTMINQFQHSQQLDLSKSNNFKQLLTTVVGYMVQKVCEWDKLQRLLLKGIDLEGLAGDLMLLVNGCVVLEQLDIRGCTIGEEELENVRKYVKLERIRAEGMWIVGNDGGRFGGFK